MQRWIVTSAILLALAVAAGAFGAHGLKARVEPSLLAIWEKAVFYHAVHALGLLVVALLPRLEVIVEHRASLICVIIFAGVVLFSGSLYLLVLTGERWLGAITPIGGVGFIAAWLLLAWWAATD